jgi:hypothetical protein
MVTERPNRPGPSLRALACLVALAWSWSSLAQETGDDAWADPPAAQPDWSVTAQFVLGAGHDTSVAGGQASAIASGIELLVRWRLLLVGAFFDATMADGTPATAYLDAQHPGYGGHESDFYGLAAGVAWAPRPWARLQLLAQGGIHEVSVESNLILPPGVARLRFVGLKAGALALSGELPRHPLVLFARRVGVVLQADLRSDLDHATVRPGVPPEVTAPPEVQVGGVSAAVVLGAVLEW